MRNRYARLNLLGVAGIDNYWGPALQVLFHSYSPLAPKLRRRAWSERNPNIGYVCRIAAAITRMDGTEQFYHRNESPHLCIIRRVDRVGPRAVLCNFLQTRYFTAI